PFDWGLEYLAHDHLSESPRDVIRQFTDEAIVRSDHFFAPASTGESDFGFDGYSLKFASGIATPYEKNNLVHARYFRAKGAKSVVIVSPQWNADPSSHVGLCEALNRFAGVSALRLSLPYHDDRMLDGFTRADYMVSANIGRTIQAVRQAVLDIRRAAD